MSWLPLLVLAGLVLNGLRLRRRAARLATLIPTGDAVRLQHRFVTAAGVELDADTRRAASAHADLHRLDVLDLVPADLPSGSAFDLLRMVNPAKYRTNRLAPGRGALHALLVDVGVAERAGITRCDGLDPVEMVELTVRLKRHASVTADRAVAPGLHARPDAPAQRLAVLRAVYDTASRIVLALPVLLWAALVAGAVVNPRWGLAAAGAFVLQPYLVFAGTSLKPRDLHRTALPRPVTDPLRWWKTVTGTWRPAPKPDPYAALKQAYAAEIGAGTDRFFEQRRTSCPWCGSGDLSVLLRSGDLVQGKPGTFTLERCGACRHVFQNPRLSIAGLDFYYRDFYDGLGEEQVEALFGTAWAAYKGRAEMVRPFTTPRSWLDVGGGHGHFCNIARDFWPHTEFDALDMSESIEEAERRRWVGQGHRGMFPDLAADLAGRYDVVSMHHYLEHTREPYEELDAARKMLPDGGHLLIEVPNPSSRLGALFGKWWMPYFQPQHQHLIPLDNLVRALEDRGFTILAADRGVAHLPVDITGAIALAVNVAAPDPRLPWRPGPPSRKRLVWREALLHAAIPVFLVTLVLDRLLGLALRRTRDGNTYRVLAVVGPGVTPAHSPLSAGPGVTPGSWGDKTAELRPVNPESRRFESRPYER